MGSIFMRFADGRAKTLTLSYDDGVQQDEKLISIMKKNGLKGTFNLNSGVFAPEGTVYPAGQIHRRLTEKQAAALYSDPDVEPALHGLTHPWFEQLTPNRMVYEAAKDRENLERIFDRIVTGMAYPYGTFSDDVVRVLKDCGVTYSRTVIETEGFAMPSDWLRLNSTCHHTNPKLMPLLNKFLEAKPARSPMMFYLWGHSYEFEQADNWNVIEEFAAQAGGHDDVWYATNGEICDYCRDFNRMIFTMDSRMVFNPTARRLWFSAGGKDYCIEGGQTIRL